MHILLTNDDGIYAPGLNALYEELLSRGDVTVIAPFVEQSGVSHTITYLDPLTVRDVYRGERLFGRAVLGTPADCVRLAMLQFCRTPVDLVVSGINSGANAGINVLYSGTVAAAIEGAFYGVTSVAVSLSESPHPDYAAAAKRALPVIDRVVQEAPPGSLWNINLPETRDGWPLGIKVLPMSLERYRETVEMRLDPKNRPYYWVGTDPRGAHVIEPNTDVEGLKEGFITVTPLKFDLNQVPLLTEWTAKSWADNR